MFKYFLFAFVLWYQIRKYAYAQSVAVPFSQNPTNCSQIAENLKKTQAITMNGHNNYHVAQQIFYVYGEQQLKRLLSNNKSIENLGDYLLTPNVGAHKLHRDKLSWNDARDTCIKEGGHLAIINSATEERILLGMLQTTNLKRGWLGLHDLYQEGNWVTVKDEPLENVGYIRWTTKFQTPQPDNYKGNQNCAVLVTEGGMDDRECNVGTPFFCEISL